jgi:rhamnosyltransferase
MYKINSVTVTFNPKIPVLQRQIASLISNQCNSIYIIDNNSNNNKEIEKLLFSYKDENIILILNDQNNGLGVAQNQGLKKAINNGATHVLILDHDSILQPNFIKNIMDDEIHLQNQGIKVGAIGATYFNEVTGEIYPITKYIGPFIERIKPTKIPVKASFLISSGCVININAVKDVGFMNEDLFIDYIDIEWSFRARKKGYSLFASPNALMSHTIGDNRRIILGRSISEHSTFRRYYLYRNSIYMIKCPYISLGYKLREITFNFLRFLIFFFYSKQKLIYLRFGLLGYLDGVLGKMGKCSHNI